ncbi:MAG: 30S ribosomal protein S9 [Candidatus Micrarchaeales archaeon]|nr:30S ribosomal protein S9 [Candidatus Micrarchaeales archaeon]
MAEVQQQQAQAQTPTPAPAAQVDEKKKKAQAKRKPQKKGEKATVTKSKRKTSVARAYIRSGKGSIKINGTSIDALEFSVIRDMMMEPLAVSNAARDLSKRVDIRVNVYGGGISSQMQAVRGAIARGLVEYSGSEALKRELMSYDRTLIIDDPRRVEPKKFKGPKARARFQTSYR